MSDLTITLAATGAALSLPLGDTITLRLPEIGGTAYLWHLRADDDLEIVADEYDTDNIIPGGENVRVLRLRPKSHGLFQLHLDRHRPWEDPNCSDAKFDASILVR